ncbi:MAG: hypothetical protein N4A57_16370 [Anaeromicrobium sp.]|jgi:chromosome segregation ATPase|uniref:hypothetical protein n=1 Tax=Anaeromicrobium sp. TaxID=1929132 RepID=UPI0025E80F29|nr:hypothetical protein [Anaeromicrobium sp.]MCT4595823.1 hypothetical protein [Anaeromicrobium sp.]
MSKNIMLDDKIIRKNKIGILIYDKVWKELFENNMTRSMKKNAKILDELCNEHKGAEKKTVLIKKKKKQLIKAILELSDEINNKNEGSIERLENMKEQLVQINDQLDENQFLLETLPKKIRKYNLEILEESTHMAYKSIEKETKRVEELESEMSILREKLGKMRDEKIGLQEKVDKVYEYIHNTLGHKEANKYDDAYL